MRKVIVLLHRYIGLALGLFLFISGLTGSLIVFGTGIDAFLNPTLLTVTPQPERASIDQVLNNARSAVPESVPTTVYLPRSADGSMEVLFQNSSMRAYADPFTGELLGVREANSYLRGFLIDLHVHLLSGETGERIVGWIGLSAIVLSLFGLWLWWPKNGRWRQAFSIKWQAGAFRVWFDIHRVGGVLVLGFLLMTLTTGAALALYDVITEPALVALTGKGARQPAPTSKASSGSAAPINPMFAQAAAMFPDGEITRLTLPAKATGAVGVRMRLNGEIHQFGRTFLWFDRYDGSLLRVDNALTAHRAIKIQSLLFPLHTGVYGGKLTQWLQVIVGLSLSLLCASGAWLWLKRTKAKVKKSV